jgi:hypothetical protein
MRDTMDGTEISEMGEVILRRLRECGMSLSELLGLAGYYDMLSDDEKKAVNMEAVRQESKIDIDTDNRMRDTGLTDKNGRKIFEGNTIRHHTNGVLCTVEFKDGAFGIKGEGINQFLCFENEYCEVVDS